MQLYLIVSYRSRKNLQRSPYNRITWRFSKDFLSNIFIAKASCTLPYITFQKLLKNIVKWGNIKAVIFTSRKDSYYMLALLWLHIRGIQACTERGLTYAPGSQNNNFINPNTLRLGTAWPHSVQERSLVGLTD